jgi:hypothetical protein
MARMKRLILVVLLGAGLAAPASADVTVKQTTTGKGMGMSGTIPGTVYIKGLKMRTDSVMDGTTRTMLFDIEAQKLYSFDSKKKEADVWNMADFGAQMGESLDTSDVTSSLTPNGQTKTLLGKTATGYDMRISMPTAVGGSKDMSMTVTLEGPMWIVKDAPGTSDYLAFYEAAAEKGWIFTDPRAAKANPGQARTVAEMHRQLAATGGVPYEQTFEIKMSGSGPMAAIMSRMGRVTSTVTVESVDTAPIDDAMFAVPAGYKLNQRK